tara:strand:- start:955 stop:1890 length:936 start_codon:yes stop_codon:yes gene_type:complete
MSINNNINRIDVNRYETDISYRLDVISQLAYNENGLKVSNLIIKKNLGKLSDKIISNVKRQIDIPLNESLKNYQKQIFNVFPINIPKNFDLLLKLEQLFLSGFSSEHLFDAIEFPIAVRTAHSELPKEYFNSKYPTDLLHIDIWAGEPSSILNALIYLGGDMDTHCVFKNQDPSILKDLFKIDSAESYKQIHHDYSYLENLPNTASPGDMYLFDSYQLHVTKRSNKLNRGRYSLDFRLCTTDPYSYYSKYKTYEEISKTRYLKYWYLSSSSANSFQKRAELELQTINDKYGKFCEYYFREQSIADMFKLEI